MFFVCGEQFAVFENYHLNHHYTEKYKNLTDTAWEWMWRFASKTAKATGTFYQALDIKGCSRHGELCHKVFGFFAIKLNKTVSKQFSHGEFIKKYFLDIAVPIWPEKRRIWRRCRKSGASVQKQTGQFWPFLLGNGQVLWCWWQNAVIHLCVWDNKRVRDYGRAGRTHSMKEIIQKD